MRERRAHAGSHRYLPAYPQRRGQTLEDLKKLQEAVIATPEAILSLIENKGCYDTGCGATDVALLASALLATDARLWTTDKDLAEFAARLRVAFAADGITAPA
jgi:hypothetical protein